jgi:hypothetical protein
MWPMIYKIAKRSDPNDVYGLSRSIPIVPIRTVGDAFVAGRARGLE